MIAAAYKSGEVSRDQISRTRELPLMHGLSVEKIQAVIEELQQAYQDGRQVLIIGNRRSAACASHPACDRSKTVLGHPVRRGVSVASSARIGPWRQVRILRFPTQLAADAVIACRESRRIAGTTRRCLYANFAAGQSPNGFDDLEI